MNDAGASVVHRIFSRYLELGSVNGLAGELRQEGIRSKRWTSRAGIERGGAVISSGALFHTLRNRIYIGETVHGKRSYPGQHDGIVDIATFEAVQAQLADNRVVRSIGAFQRAPLTGLVFDAQGNRMSPVHTRNRHGARYVYYVPSPLQKGGTTALGTFSRVAAKELETAPFERLRTWSGRRDATRDELIAGVRRIVVRATSLRIELDAADEGLPAPALAEGEATSITEAGCLVIDSPVRLGTRGGPTSIVRNGAAFRSKPNKSLISALRRAHAELAARNVDRTVQRSAFDEARGVDDPYLRKLTAIAFLAPDIQRAILQGRQPPGMTLHQLVSEPLPLDWSAQRAKLGFAAK